MANPGISISWADPLWKPGRSGKRNRLARLESASHEIAAMGGFKSASYTTKALTNDIEDWLENGLGRDILAIDHERNTTFEGFVNGVSGNMGALSIVRGPLTGVANRILCLYTPILDATTDPMITGTTRPTPIAENLASQAKYGVLEKVISLGQRLDDGTTNEAIEARDACLEEYAEPDTSQALNLFSPSEPSVTLDVLGYEAFLDQYFHDDENAGVITVPTKIRYVLASDPNGVFSADYSRIADDAGYQLLTPRLEVQYRIARVILQEMLEQGDANDTRTLFGIYENRQACYHVIPASASYRHRVTGARQTIKTAAEVVVHPWNVRPGQWVFMPDFLTGKSQPGERLRSDPRFLFVESVGWSSPYSIQINGGRVTKAKQLLAKLGVSA